MRKEKLIWRLLCEDNVLGFAFHISHNCHFLDAEFSLYFKIFQGAYGSLNVGRRERGFGDEKLLLNCVNSPKSAPSSGIQVNAVLDTQFAAVCKVNWLRLVAY